MKPKITVIIIAALCLCYFQHFAGNVKASSTKKAEEPLKSKALKILENKCNVCHRIQNPRRMFTYDNMDDLAPKIYKQVYVKKRMPKGNPSLLNKEEKDVLLNWLRTKIVIEK